MDYYVLVYRPDDGDEDWRLVEPADDTENRSSAIAELVRQAMRIDDELATQLLTRILEGEDPEQPLRLYDPDMRREQEPVWLCIARNDVTAVEPALPQLA